MCALVAYNKQSINSIYLSFYGKSKVLKLRTAINSSLILFESILLLIWDKSTPILNIKLFAFENPTSTCYLPRLHQWHSYQTLFIPSTHQHMHNFTLEHYRKFFGKLKKLVLPPFYFHFAVRYEKMCNFYIKNKTLLFLIFSIFLRHQNKHFCLFFNMKIALRFIMQYHFGKEGISY